MYNTSTPSFQQSVILSLPDSLSILNFDKNIEENISIYIIQLILLDKLLNTFL